MKSFVSLTVSILMLAGPSRGFADSPRPPAVIDVDMAGQRLAAIEQFIGTLSANVREPSGALAAPDQEILESTIAQLDQTAQEMRAGLAGGADPSDLGECWSHILEALGRVERAGQTATLTRDQWELLSGIRWNLRQLGLVLMVSGGTPSFVVGPVSVAQASDLCTSLDRLGERADALAEILNSEPGDITYRNLLLSQMDALVPNADTARSAVTGPSPWWTFEANQAVTRLLRVVALTPSETRNLPGVGLEALSALQGAAQQVERATNAIEGGARDAGPDAVMVYRPAGAMRASR